MLGEENLTNQLGYHIIMQDPKWQKGQGESATVPPNIGGSHPSNHMGPVAK